VRVTHWITLFCFLALLIGWVVYERLGLALLRKAWLNLDLIWAVALITTGGLTLLLPWLNR
jgi:hypothetical protein